MFLENICIWVDLNKYSAYHLIGLPENISECKHSSLFRLTMKKVFFWPASGVVDVLWGAAAVADPVEDEGEDAGLVLVPMSYAICDCNLLS